MSYQIKIDGKSRKAARFISLLQKKIQRALVASGKTQQEVASILGIDRSVVNRRLSGSANLTARSIAEFAYAFDKDIFLEFVERGGAKASNRVLAVASMPLVTSENFGVTAPAVSTNERGNLFELAE